MKRNIVYLILLSPLFGCLEEIPYQIDSDAQKQLVVDGGLKASESIHEIILSWTGSVTGKNPFQPARGAMVQISDGESLFDFIESELNPGHYYSDTISVDISKTYFLTIKLNGQQYEASAKGVISKPFEPIEYLPSEGGDVLGDNPQGFYYIELPGNFGGGEPYLYYLEYEVPKDWKVDYPYPIPAELMRWGGNGLVDTTYLIHPGIEPAALFEYSQSIVDGLPIGTKLTEKRFYLSNDYYVFLRAISMETDWRGSNIMQTIPANVPSNINNGALGYFYVYDSFEVETYIQEE